MLLLDDSGCSGLYDVVWRRVWCARACARDLTESVRECCTNPKILVNNVIMKRNSQKPNSDLLCMLRVTIFTYVNKGTRVPVIG
jgi:hypothetical protein